MMFNKEAFKLMATATDSYPYNEIRTTRQGFLTSWLLVRIHQGEQPRFRPRRRKQAIHTSSLDKDTVTHLIVSGQALPVPQDYCDVLDVLDWWGRRISQSWYESVVEMMYCDLYNGQKVDRGCLFKNCISFHMNDMADDAVGLDRSWIILCWHNFFDHTYMYDTKDFFFVPFGPFITQKRRFNMTMSLQLWNSMAPLQTTCTTMTSVERRPHFGFFFFIAEVQII